MRTFAQRGRWSTILTVVNSLQEATVTVAMTRRLSPKERFSLKGFQGTEIIPVSFRHHVRYTRVNTEDPKKGKFFGKVVVEYGFTNVLDLLAFANNYETLIRQYENSIKHRATPTVSPVSKELQG